MFGIPAAPGALSSAQTGRNAVPMSDLTSAPRLRRPTHGRKAPGRGRVCGRVWGCAGLHRLGRLLLALDAEVASPADTPALGAYPAVAPRGGSARQAGCATAV